MNNYDSYTNFDSFCELLQEIKNYESNGNYELVKDNLLPLNKFLNSIIVASEKKLKEIKFDQSLLKNMEDAIDGFYEKYFNLFDNNAVGFSNLFDKKRIPQVYRLKIYLLNHLVGDLELMWSKFTNQKSETKLYLLSKYYLDYYESFAMFLKPFLKKLKQKEIKNIPRSYHTAYNLYAFLYQYFIQILKFPGQSLEERDYDWFFDNKFRNIIAHGKYFIDGNSISIYEIRGEKFQKLKYTRIEIEARYEFLRNFAVIFTTLLDIKINNLFLSSNESELKPLWVKYFIEYYKSWENFHKDKFKPENDS